MPKITGLGAGAAPANTDVIVLVSNTAGTANTQKVTVNTFFSSITANAKFANAEITLANVVNGVINASSVTATTVQGTTSVKTPLIEFTDGDDAITISDGGGVTITALTSTSVKTPLIEFTDGDDAIAIADGGLVTIANVTAIGGTTAGTGAFSNLSSDTVAHSVQAVTADGALDLTKTVHTLSGASASCQTTLANGTITGQIKYIISIDVTNTVDVDFATSLGAGATYTFHEVGTCIQCLWTGAAWTILTVHSNFAQPNLSGSTGRIRMEDQTGNIILDRTTSGGADAGDELIQEGNQGVTIT
tara:strand:- start:3992 stop:4903 length:912 start_codon:yes stop_codon:yes gene_type:complete